MASLGYIRTDGIDNEQILKARSQIIALSIKKGIYQKVEFIEEEFDNSTFHYRKISQKLLRGIINSLKEGDYVLIYDLTHLGRSMVEICRNVEELRRKKAEVFSIAEKYKSLTVPRTYWPSPGFKVPQIKLIEETIKARKEGVYTIKGIY